MATYNATPSAGSTQSQESLAKTDTTFRRLLCVVTAVRYELHGAVDLKLRRLFLAERRPGRTRQAATRKGESQQGTPHTVRTRVCAGLADPVLDHRHEHGPSHCSAE